jgi:demethoxyubiquinone hydroxylase (CLK1/Coq7/Cat5 family)
MLLMLHWEQLATHHNSVIAEIHQLTSEDEEEHVRRAFSQKRLEKPSKAFVSHVCAMICQSSLARF